MACHRSPLTARRNPLEGANQQATPATAVPVARRTTLGTRAPAYRQSAHGARTFPRAPCEYNRPRGRCCPWLAPEVPGVHVPEGYVRPALTAWLAMALVLLSGLSAEAFVGDAVLLTQRAESLLLDGHFDASCRARTRAREYAEETLVMLGKSRAPADPEVVALFHSIIEECGFWLTDEHTVAQQLDEVRHDAEWVGSHLEPAMGAEAEWRDAARRGNRSAAEDALDRAVSLREDLVHELEARISDPDDHRLSHSEGFYLGHALVRLRWALGELRAEGDEWHDRTGADDAMAPAPRS